MRNVVVTLIDLPPKGEVQTAILGPSNDSSFDSTHPAPGLEVMLPGDRIASRGGGDKGGAQNWTGRKDTEDLRSQMWNHPDRYQTPRQKTGHKVRSAEAIVRQPDPKYKPTTDRRKRSRDGNVKGNAGTAEGRGRLAVATNVTSHRSANSKEVLNAETAKKRVARNSGTTANGVSKALVDRGTKATETHKKGRVSDKRTTAGLSHEHNPQPFEMSKASGNGKPSGQGVAGPTTASGVSRRGRGVGTAATTASVLPGWGRPSSHAPLEHPYFRRIYKRLDRYVKFPRELAISLAQGEVIVRFTLHSNGKISGISIDKRSGHRQFDRALIVALKRAAPFGRVPRSILKGSRSMTVKAPYLFSNPLIQ